MNRSLIILLSLFFLSRLIFHNSGPVFFDSPEYLSRLASPNFFNAISSGHLPLHAGYVMTFWPIYQLANKFNINPAETIIIFQILLSLMTLYAFYRIVQILIDGKTALISIMLTSLIPIFWVSNASIMMENTYISYLIFAFFFLLNYLKKANNNFSLILSSVFFGLSFVSHSLVILWLPLFFYVVFMQNKKKINRFLLFFIGFLLTFTLFNGFLISVSQNTDIFIGTKSLFMSKIGEHAQLSFSFTGILGFLRNYTIPMLRNNTNLLIIISLISLIRLYFKDKKFFILLLLWIAPSLIANQWWDSLYYGRHALFSSFAIAILSSIILSRNKLSLFAVTVYLIVSVVPAILLLKSNIPYILEAKEAAILPHEGLFIESHFARPQTDNKYQGKTVFVEEPGWEKDKLENQIKENLESQKPVFISSQALSEPYGLYSGPYIHSLSLSYKNDYVLKKIITAFSIKEYKIISKEDNLIIYEIISSSPSLYPKIPILRYSKRRIDYYDPITQIWFLINRSLLKK